MSAARLKALKLVLLATAALMLATPAYAAQEKTLVTFHNGGLPSDGLVAWQGKLYGSTEYGGQYGLGNVFEISQSGGVFTYKSIYDFKPEDHAAGPMWAVTFDRAGNLYGTLPSSGTHAAGAIYRLSPENDTWRLTVIYNFTGDEDGFVPDSKLTFDPEGNLYGATTFGGTTGSGTIFQLIPSGDHWTERTIHTFNGATDGRSPEELVLSNDGRLFGFGCQAGPANKGTIFQLTKDGDNWQFTVLYDFGAPNDGSFITGRPVLDGEGHIYGSSQRGGASDLGTLFRFDLNTGVNTILHSFEGVPDAATPYEDLLLDRQGHIWGAAGGGTGNGGSGFGTIFEYIPAEASYKLVYRFGQSGGHFPNGRLIQDLNGNLYGTTEEGGPDEGTGTVFQIKP
ncbi:MAG: hypothetical protein H0X25_12090 [Acidobacteriales bacterium]|nr:hypothetical protein [Terriglobales bacterium]